VVYVHDARPWRQWRTFERANDAYALTARRNHLKNAAFISKQALGLIHENGLVHFQHVLLRCHSAFDTRW
jgi:hypothetical protein